MNALAMIAACAAGQQDQTDYPELRSVYLSPEQPWREQQTLEAEPVMGCEDY